LATSTLLEEVNGQAIDYKRAAPSTLGGDDIFNLTGWEF
jgi:hypothetical protein